MMAAVGNMKQKSGSRPRGMTNPPQNPKASARGVEKVINATVHCRMLSAWEDLYYMSLYRADEILESCTCKVLC